MQEVCSCQHRAGAAHADVHTWPGLGNTSSVGGYSLLLRQSGMLKTYVVCSMHTRQLAGVPLSTAHIPHPAARCLIQVPHTQMRYTQTTRCKTSRGMDCRQSSLVIMLARRARQHNCNLFMPQTHAASCLLPSARAFQPQCGAKAGPAQPAAAYQSPPASCAVAAILCRPATWDITCCLWLSVALKRRLAAAAAWAAAAASQSLMPAAATGQNNSRAVTVSTCLHAQL
jgi:hypothetical protein